MSENHTPSFSYKRSRSLWGLESPLVRDARYALALQLAGFILGLASAFADALAAAIVFGAIFVGGTAWALYALYTKERFGDAYETLEIEQHFDLYDISGQEAKRSIYRELRFIQNDVLAIRDYVWGDGTPVEKYECRPGRAVDFYKIGRIIYVLIALDEIARRGDVRKFYSSHKMLNTFTDSSEWISFMSPTPTNRAVLRVTFPKDRPPQEMSLSRDFGDRKLDTPIHRDYVDGRLQIVVILKRPAPHQEYSFHWSW